MIVVTPFLSVLIVVIDFSVPEPWIVVPVGRFEHVADDMSKLTGLVVTSGGAATALPAPSANAAIAKTASADRFTFSPFDSYTEVVVRARTGQGEPPTTGTYGMPAGDAAGNPFPLIAAIVTSGTIVDK